MDAIQGNISQIIERPVYPHLANVAGNKMIEPTPRQKEAYQTAREFPSPSPIADLADLAQYATAAAMEAEHILYQHNGILDDCEETYDWLKEADEKLREVKR